MTLAESFSRLVASGDVVVWGQGPAEPVALVRALAERARGLTGLRCFVGIPSATPMPAADAAGLGLVSYCGAGVNRTWHAAGSLDILPVHYSTLPAVLSRGDLRADVVLLQVPSPAPDGTVGYGLACEYLPAAVRAARHVVVEINPLLPDIAGPRLELDRLIVLGTFPRELPAPATAPEREVDARIAERVLELVPDGATLQFGLGSVPAAVAARLTGHRRLGVHSGMVGDEVVDLMRSGAVTNELKTVDRGITVTGLFVGSRATASFVDGNPSFQLRETADTHDARVLAALPAFTAVNSAVEVDLTGQVNAESVNGRYVGAVGGAVDFLRGAASSQGGTPIVALPALAAGCSRIVPRLSGAVSTARSDAGVVVTEHGVADLRGLTLQRRREAMVAIAAPHVRDDLARTARVR